MLPRLLLLALLLLGGCASAPPTPSHALPAHGTDLGAAVHKHAEAHPGQSGFRLLASSTDALIARWELIRKAQRISADLLVVENHHGTGRHPARWLLAYTDWELLRLCPIPVLLVKNRRLYHRPRVLAAIDPSHAHAKPSNLDRQILRAGAQLVHALHGELHALHALLPAMPMVPALPDGPLADMGVGREEIVEAARSQLAKAVDGFDVKPSHCHLEEGRANEVIPRTARRERCSIVAMGVVSRSGLKRFFIGNTAEYVMDAVTADILVVKPPDFESRVPRAGRGVQILSLPILPG